MEKQIPGERKWQYFLVAFMDIMGQQQEFEGVDHLPRTPEEVERLKQADLRTVGFLEKIRSGFKTYFETFSAPTTLADRLPPDQRALFESMRKSEITSRSFSDLVLVEVSLLEEPHATNVLRGIGGVLVAAGGMCLTSFMEKHAMRGAVEISIGTRLSTGEVYGPVLNRAYHLESAVAQYPRIVVGRGVIEYLLSQKARPQGDLVQKCCVDLANLYLDMIAEDRDGIPIIDYLGPRFREVVATKVKTGERDPLDLDQMAAKALAFIRSQKERWLAEGRMNLYQRYSLAENYILSRVTSLQST